jgi:hypothetical protein
MATAEDVIAGYVKLRDMRAEQRKAWEAEDKLLEEKQDKLEAWLLAKFQEIGSESFKGAAGTAYRQVVTKTSCGDWGNFHAFVGETGRWDFLEKRLSSKAIKEYIDEGNDAPPGVTLFNEFKVVVRRA